MRLQISLEALLSMSLLLLFALASLLAASHLQNSGRVEYDRLMNYSCYARGIVSELANSCTNCIVPLPKAWCIQ